MNFLSILLVTLGYTNAHSNGVSFGNRMGHFRNYHGISSTIQKNKFGQPEKAAKKEMAVAINISVKVKAANKPNLQRVKSKVMRNKICNPATCTKCTKVLFYSFGNRNLQNYCTYLLKLHQCCTAKTLMLRGGF